MKLIIEARLVDDSIQTKPVQLAVIDREMTDTALGLSLAEGKTLLASAQEILVRAQCEGIAEEHSCCERCGSKLCLKGWHERQIRTVFGRVKVRSARLRYCACAGKHAGASFSPLVQVLPACVSPELEYLQVKWAAHLPYAAATQLLAEVLPISQAISVTGVKRRVRAVGAELEQPAAAAQHPQNSPRPPLAALAVDSAWLRHCKPPADKGRHVNLVVGRACFEDGPSRVYAYVHNQVTSAAARLNGFLRDIGVDPTARLTILSDGAGEFDKAARDCAQPLCRILDWFHVAMKFQAAENAVFGCKQIESQERLGIQSEIRRAKWLVWHGKIRKARARIEALDNRLLKRPDYEFSTLWWNLRNASGYLKGNARYAVNYARRHHKGLPVSSAIAESAVNQVVSCRMAKKRQMRWSDEGAHLLAQIRVRAINGELKPRAVPIPFRPPKPKADPWLDGYLLREAA